MLFLQREQRSPPLARAASRFPRHRIKVDGRRMRGAPRNFADGTWKSVQSADSAAHRSESLGNALGWQSFAGKDTRDFTLPPF